ATQELVGADNDFSARERAPYYLANASILHTLGIAESVDSLRVLLQTPDGVKRELTLPRIAGEIVNWWYFRQERGPRPQDCATLLSRFDADKPFHIDYRDRAYWFEVLPEQNTVYMQLSAVQDLGEETFAGFTRRLFDYIDNHAVGKLVIDIRYNGGGDGSMLWPFVYEIIKRDRINQRGRLFVITGPKTFSAATMAACHLANHTNALLVGEPVGAGMNHHGDAVGFTLPNSGYTLNVSTLYWQFGYPTDRRAYIPPDYPAVMTAAAYFAGRDPALEAILNGDATSVKDIALRDGVDAALAWYERAKAKFTDIDWWVPFTEREANSLGYELLELGNTADAVTIFTLNADAFPQSWNVWDSLGEAHLAAGHRADALRCYRKSLELNPGNGHAQMVVRNLESGR
ncbi:MAG TPA: tetratricopeptide repeat protein, partial [candidate division Zixibacteria bacterium]|nr:tetratricopeptide repeat protein [candidate division Zixibacteria bacterium]